MPQRVSWKQTQEGSKALETRSPLESPSYGEPTNILLSKCQGHNARHRDVWPGIWLTPAQVYLSPSDPELKLAALVQLKWNVPPQHTLSLSPHLYAVSLRILSLSCNSPVLFTATSLFIGLNIWGIDDYCWTLRSWLVEEHTLSQCTKHLLNIPFSELS